MANSAGHRNPNSAMRAILGFAVIATFASLIVTGSSGSHPAQSQAGIAAPLSGAEAQFVRTAEVASTTWPGGFFIATAMAAGGKPRYLDAVYSDLHFKPAIEKATNEQCMACHKDILDRPLRKESPAGVKTADSIAWYQTLDTYGGQQMNFHARHMASPFAKQVMDLKCNFCHKGHEPREETWNSSATTTASIGESAMRKSVNPSETCLLCHGKFPAEVMGLEGSWADLREGMESAETPNGCLTCHAEQFRTVRHQVSYLKADAIEEAAKNGSSDTCYGCHGGRAWYMNSYPYPRHAWEGMDKDVPDWAKGRPTESKAEYRLKAN